VLNKSHKYQLMVLQNIDSASIGW